MNSKALEQTKYDITQAYDISNQYVMVISAWEMPSLFSDLHIFDNDENSPNLLVDGIGEIVMSELTDVATDSVEVLSDIVNIAKNSGNMSEALGNMVDSATQSLKDVMSKLTEYTNGAEPKRDKYVCQFVLPTPQNLTDTLRHQYDQDTFSPLETVKHLGSWLTKKLVNSEATNRVLDSAMEFNIKQAKRNNFAFDNNLINVYKQTEQREFIFNISLLPQSYDHYKQILATYARLKILMTGTKVGANMAMVQTHSFTITFMNQYFENYMLLNDKVDLNLETLEIDVSGNPYVTFNNYVPKSMQMILTFRERRPLRNDVEINKLITDKEQK